jgi:hypothetical protein
LAILKNPKGLNIYQRFQQVKSILGESSRLKNEAWYLGPLESNLQLHLRVDGATIVSFYHDRSKGRWSNGPALTEEILYDALKLGLFVTETVRYATSVGALSLGVVLYIADEFAVTELKPEFDSPGSLDELRLTAITEPSTILQDSSITQDQAAWRILPYPAGGGSIGTAVTISQHYSPLFKLLREFAEKENFPITTQALSAPLIAILGLQEILQTTPNKPYIAILQYPWYTVLACFNENSDLRLVRTLQHRGLRRPTNFRNSLATTNAALEFVDPDLFLVPLGSNVDTALASDLQASFAASKIEVVEQTPRERMPTWCPEPIIATQPDITKPANSSLTFQMLRGEKWAFQDFLPTPPEIAEIYPSRSETRLLQFVKLARLALILPMFLGFGYLVYSAFTISQRPESKFDTAQATQTKARLAGLVAEQSKIENLNNLLDDRSKGWVNMEMFAAMFPEGSGILVKSFNFTAKPDIPSNVSGPKPTKSGFTREWKISGLVKDRRALKILENLNDTTYLTKLFVDVASTTGDQSYATSPGSRILIPTLTNKENPIFKVNTPDPLDARDETSYERSFDLTVKQEFNTTDTLSINVSKAK